MTPQRQSGADPILAATSITLAGPSDHEVPQQMSRTIAVKTVRASYGVRGWREIPLV
jgi:hypothetical protein